ncbi:MAG TPA: nuclear transport factor 2 family protein [Thermoplasmata archaeon]|jgi:hypothetical protein
MTLETPQVGTPIPTEVARHFLQSLHDGRLVDALDTFTPDASVSYEPGPPQRGFRRIAGSLLTYRSPGRIEIAEISAVGERVNALVRLMGQRQRSFRPYRVHLEVQGGRIRSAAFRHA